MVFDISWSSSTRLTGVLGVLGVAVDVVMSVVVLSVLGVSGWALVLLVERRPAERGTGISGVTARLRRR